VASPARGRKLRRDNTKPAFWEVLRCGKLLTVKVRRGIAVVFGGQGATFGTQKAFAGKSPAMERAGRVDFRPSRGAKQSETVGDPTVSDFFKALPLRLFREDKVPAEGLAQRGLRWFGTRAGQGAVGKEHAHLKLVAEENVGAVF